MISFEQYQFMSMKIQPQLIIISSLILTNPSIAQIDRRTSEACNKASDYIACVKVHEGLPILQLHPHKGPLSIEVIPYKGNKNQRIRSLPQIRTTRVRRRQLNLKPWERTNDEWDRDLLDY